MAGYWALPVTAALSTTAHAIAADLPGPEQGWSDKLSRMLTALKNANTPMAQHRLQLEDDAIRGRNRERKGDGATGANDDLN